MTTLWVKVNDFGMLLAINWYNMRNFLPKPIVRVLSGLIVLFSALIVETLQASFWVSSTSVRAISANQCSSSFSEAASAKYEAVNKLIEYQPESKSLVTHKSPENISQEKVLQNHRELVIKRFLEERLLRIKDPSQRQGFEKRIRTYENNVPLDKASYVIGQAEKLSFSFRLAKLREQNEQIKTNSILDYLQKNVSSEQLNTLEMYPNIVQLGLFTINVKSSDFKFDVFRLISVELKDMLAREVNAFNAFKLLRRSSMGQIMIKPTLFIGVLKKGLAPRLYKGLDYQYFVDKNQNKLLTEHGYEIIFAEATSFIQNVGHSVYLLENAFRTHYGHEKHRNYYEQMQLDQRKNIWDDLNSM